MQQRTIEKQKYFHDNDGAEVCFPNFKRGLSLLSACVIKFRLRNRQFRNKVNLSPNGLSERGLTMIAKGNDCVN